ncbi:sigma 54-interacting transcriptional regulator [Desulfofundulus sp.]|uniref:sigma 54-interacting transcriptional regulator n=1 Tax=Desulfofundulus sp. TaxID=2282750 RepID=UPI003C71834C
MRMKDMMTTGVPLLYPGDSLRRAVELFRITRLTSLPVTDRAGKLLGIFTRFNLFDCLLSGHDLGQAIDPFYMRQVVTTFPDVPYQDIAEVVKKSPVGMGVVVDQENHVLGVFTKVDMIMALFKQADLLNARLQAVYRAMHNGLIMVDATERVVLLNPAAEKVLGVTEEKVRGKFLSDVFPELSLKEVITAGVVEIGRKHMFKGRAFMVNATPIICGGGTVGAVAIFQDLTDLEHLAAELETVQQLHNTLETVLEIACDGIVVVDEDGRVTLINQALAEFLQLRPQEVAGRHVTEILENSRLHIVARTGLPEYADLQTIGGHRFLVSNLPIVKNGRVTGAVGKILFRKLEEVRELARRLDAVENKLTYYREQLHKVGGVRYTFDSIVSVSAVMESLKKEALRAARGCSTILIQGESGTGKELLAQAIHAASSRRDRPFIKVNCAAIPDSLLESEFFGYAPGAFTGAQKGGKPGKFEMADGGTIFLDEIGDMSPALQAKLLRVLQDREFERVGGTRTIRVDVRIIAATNRNLAEMVTEGKFREDLYYRLNVIPLFIPPLRSRREDILPLVYHFLQKYNALFGTRVERVSPEALLMLQSYPWPGNVRELENVCERGVNFATGKTMGVPDLPAYIRNYSGRLSGGDAGKDAPFYRQKLREAEKDILAAALEVAGGSKTRAACILGISRSRLYAKLKKTGLMD